MRGMDDLTFMAVLGAAILLGAVWGVKLEQSANQRARGASPGRRRATKTSGDASAPPEDKLAEKPRKKCPTTSKLIALGVLAMDASCTYIVLYFCWLSIKLQFSGSLPYLTTLIGALQAATAVVLSGYFYKSGKENTKGGITYDAALGKNPTVSKSDTTDIFGTV